MEEKQKLLTQLEEKLDRIVQQGKESSIEIRTRMIENLRIENSASVSLDEYYATDEALEFYEQKEVLYCRAIHQLQAMNLMETKKEELEQYRQELHGKIELWGKNTIGRNLLLRYLRYELRRVNTEYIRNCYLQSTVSTIVARNVFYFQKEMLEQAISQLSYTFQNENSFFKKKQKQKF